MSICGTCAANIIPHDNRSRGMEHFGPTSLSCLLHPVYNYAVGPNSSALPHGYARLHTSPSNFPDSFNNNYNSVPASNQLRTPTLEIKQYYSFDKALQLCFRESSRGSPFSILYLQNEVALIPLAAGFSCHETTDERQSPGPGGFPLNFKRIRCYQLPFN